MNVKFNVVITSEPPWYVAKCLDNSVASQGKTIEEAMKNLREALELYYDGATEYSIPTASPSPVFLTM